VRQVSPTFAGTCVATPPPRYPGTSTSQHTGTVPQLNKQSWNERQQYAVIICRYQYATCSTFFGNSHDCHVGCCRPSSSPGTAPCSDVRVHSSFAINNLSSTNKFSSTISHFRHFVWGVSAAASLVHTTPVSLGLRWTDLDE